MTDRQTAYRNLRFDDLDAALAECQSLSRTGYQRHGNWTLAQICHHLRVTQDASVDGYPKWMSLFAPIRPVMRRLMLPRLLAGNSVKGLPTSSIYVPPEDLTDESELIAFEESVRRLRAHPGEYYPHPGFGRFDRNGIERLHTAHAAHHLGFLTPSSSGD